MVARRGETRNPPRPGVCEQRSLLPGALSEMTNEQFSLDLSELEDI